MTALIEPLPGFSLPGRDSYMVTDMDKKMIAGAKAAQDVITHHLGCVDHQIQTCLKNASEQYPTVLGAIQEAAGISKKIHMSSVAVRTMKDEAARLKGTF